MLELPWKMTWSMFLPYLLVAHVQVACATDSAEVLLQISQQLFNSFHLGMIWCHRICVLCKVVSGIWFASCSWSFLMAWVQVWESLKGLLLQICILFGSVLVGLWAQVFWICHGLLADVCEVRGVGLQVTKLESVALAQPSSCKTFSYCYLAVCTQIFSKFLLLYRFTAICFLTVQLLSGWMSTVMFFISTYCHRHA